MAVTKLSAGLPTSKLTLLMSHRCAARKIAHLNPKETDRRIGVRSALAAFCDVDMTVSQCDLCVYPALWWSVKLQSGSGHVALAKWWRSRAPSRPTSHLFH